MDETDGELTHESVRRIEEMASIAGKEALRLSDVEEHTLHKYLPDWCGSKLYDTRALVQQIAWILYGASESTLGPDTPPPERPRWAAVHASDIARVAYKDLCGKQDEYIDAEKVAIDRDYKDRGYIKQPNGDWHPPKEMEVGQ